MSVCEVCCLIAETESMNIQTCIPPLGRPPHRDRIENSRLVSRAI